MDKETTHPNEGRLLAPSSEKKAALGFFDFDIAAGEHTQAITNGFGEDDAASFIDFKCHAI